MIELKLSEFSAVIFDMDGTMVANMGYHKLAWQQFLKKHKIPLSAQEFVQKFSGKKNEEILSSIFKQPLSSDEVAHFTAQKEGLYRELYSQHMREIPGLSETIRSLQKHDKKLGIATTAPKANRDFVLETLELNDAFDAILGDEHVTNGKPDPEIYLEAAQQLDVAPSRCLVFEDSPAGVASAKGAGMRVVAILSSHPNNQLADADYLINDFTGVTFV